MYSIVIPAYNEEKRLPYTLRVLNEGLKLHKKEYEIVVVDDGSSDKTCEVAKNEILVKLPCNMGKGAAITEGLKRAKGDIVVILDADMPTTVEELLVLGGLTNRYDIVIGSRRMDNSWVYRSKHKKFISCMFGRFTRIMTGLPYRDTQCGVKILKISAVEKIIPLLSEQGFLIDIDILYAANKVGCSVKEEGILWIDREGSKVNLLRDSFKMAVGLVHLKGRYLKKEKNNWVANRGYSH